MPRDPSCPLSHCPVGKSSGCFPITPEIQPCMPSPLPSPTHCLLLLPYRMGSQPRKDIFEKAFPNLLPNIRAISLLVLVTTWNHSSCSTLSLFVTLHQIEAPGNQGTLSSLILLRPPGPQGWCSK